jgi:hypothetical protein
MHGLSKGHYVPLAYFLLANKHETSNEDVFRHMVSEAAKLGVIVFLTIVYGDFETAFHNALTTVWPGCEVKACCFHLGQSWWRKRQSLGLTKQYGRKDCRVSQRLLGVGLYIQSSERHASRRVLRLPARKLRVLMQTPLFLRLLGSNVLHHH